MSDSNRRLRCVELLTAGAERGLGIDGLPTTGFKRGCSKVCQLALSEMLRDGAYKSWQFVHPARVCGKMTIDTYVLPCVVAVGQTVGSV